MTRPTNQELCQQFRHLLTHGFYTDPPDQAEQTLIHTKSWRNDVWKAFSELERRLCPSPAEFKGQKP